MPPRLPKSDTVYCGTAWATEKGKQAPRQADHNKLFFIGLVFMSRFLRTWPEGQKRIGQHSRRELLIDSERLLMRLLKYR